MDQPAKIIATKHRVKLQSAKSAQHDAASAASISASNSHGMPRMGTA
jgi:hypothetical protein